MSFSDPALILPGAVTNTEVNATAAIAYSKLNLASSIVIGDMAASLYFNSFNDVSGARASGNAYQNTSGKPMLVVVAITLTAGAGTVILYSDAANPPTQEVDYFSTNQAVTGVSSVHYIIKAGNWYKYVISGAGASQRWVHETT